MSLVVFPFKSEDLGVLGTNLRIASDHPRVSQIWAVAAAEGAAMDAVVDLASAMTGVEVMAQQRLGRFRSGKGDGMNTALDLAAESGFERVHFYDADITNFNAGWIDGAEAAADAGFQVVRHRFPRAATDAMITWMITRPLFALGFPGTALPRIGQPLGGELLLSGDAVSHLVNDPLVRDRSDWGVDTVITYSLARSGLATTEHHIADGKRHALYGSLAELRTMLVECLDAAISLLDHPTPASALHSSPPQPVPDDLKHTVGFDLESSRSLLRDPPTPQVADLLDQLHPDVRSGLSSGQFELINAERWRECLEFLADGFALGEPHWEDLAFRLWVGRVLSYTLGPVSHGYDAAMDYLEATIVGYERHD